jgi:protein-S-isoprenylcysteine O-methyltransferase Ste14
MKTDAHSLKGQGYVVSIASVFLLAVPPLKTARDPLMIGLIVVGALLSIAGMAFRWIADRKTQHRIDRAQDEGQAAMARSGDPAPGH